ncbi:MAG: hypothetical protein AB7V45_07285 [Candidatus Krumholzibacteriia bacterium]
MDQEIDRKAAIAGLLAYKKSLSEKIKTLQSDLEAIDRSLSLLGVESVKRASIAPDDGSLGDLSPQKAIDWFLQANPGRWYSTAEALAWLGQNGMDIQDRTTKSALAAALHRAVKKGLAARRAIKGKKNRFEYCLAGSVRHNDGELSI